MGAQAPGEFPYPLDGIQIGAVRRQKVQAQDLTMLAQPRLEDSGMMPTCVVHENYHRALLSPVTYEPLQERLEALRIECLVLLCDETSVGHAHGAEYADTLSRRRVQHHGIHVLGRYPHATP